MDQPNSFQPADSQSQNQLPNQTTPMARPEPAIKNRPPPVKIKLPNLNLKRSHDIISYLEEKLKTKVICYYTALESFIAQTHPDLFFDHLKEIGEQETISMVLISSGGESAASLRMATIIREYCKNLQIIVASRCASAATVLALSADKIIMSPAGYLTAIDSALTHPLNPKGNGNQPIAVSVDQVKRVLKFLREEGDVSDEKGKNEGPYRTLFRYLHPMALGEIDRYSSGSELIARKMMKMHPGSFKDDKEIERIAKHLVNDYPLHAFPILYDEAKEIGLPVEKADKELSNILWDLTKVCDSASKRTVTNFSPDFYHFEGFPVFIESANKRSTHRYSYNKRFNPVTKIWQIENDNTRWVNFKPDPEGRVPFRMNEIDLPEITDTPVETNQPIKSPLFSTNQNAPPAAGN